MALADFLGDGDGGDDGGDGDGGEGDGDGGDGGDGARLDLAVRYRVDVGDPEPYGAIDSLEGLLGLAQMGVLELHIWGSHRDRIEQPDYIVFDHDPDEGLEDIDVDHRVSPRPGRPWEPRPRSVLSTAILESSKTP